MMKKYLWVQKLFHRPHQRNDGGHEDETDDQNAGHVFKFPIAVWVSAGRSFSGQGKGEPQGNPRETVGDVMEGVGKERNAAGEYRDASLKRRRHSQNQKRDDKDGRRLRLPLPVPGRMPMTVVRMPIVFMRMPPNPVKQRHDGLLFSLIDSKILQFGWRSMNPFCI
jgi:hypothetical protein